MLERKRLQRGYDAVAGEDGDEELADLELGEGSGTQEEGIMSAVVDERSKTLEEEVDTWDENAVDAWDDADDGDGDIGIAPTTSTRKGKEVELNGGDVSEPKKRVD